MKVPINNIQTTMFSAFLADSTIRFYSAYCVGNLGYLGYTAFSILVISMLYYSY